MALRQYASQLPPVELVLGTIRQLGTPLRLAAVLQEAKKKHGHEWKVVPGEAWLQGRRVGRCEPNKRVLPDRFIKTPHQIDFKAQAVGAPQKCSPERTRNRGAAPNCRPLPSFA